MTEYSTRRRFLGTGLSAGAVIAVGGGLSTFLQACGGSSSSSSSAKVTADDVANASGSINVLTFSFYETPAFNSGPVKATYVPVAGGDEIVTKFRTVSNLNMGVTGGNVIQQLISIDQLEPIQTDLIENYQKIDPAVRDHKIFKSGSDTYGVPFTITPSLTAWNSDEVPEPVTADDLLKPDYKGKIGLYDDAGTIVQFGQLLGMDIYNLTTEDLDKITAYMDELKPNVKTVFVIGDEIQLFARNDIAVAFVTFGSLFTTIAKANPKIKANLAGAVSFVDCWSVPKGADKVAASLNWMNNTVSMKSQVALPKTSATQPVIQAAMDPSLYPPVLANLSIKELLEKAPVMPGSPVEGDGLATLDMVQKAWTSYKASF